jgi:hypothetical protein
MAERLDGWEEHRRRQIRDIARNTTPAQRLAWVEEMIDLVRLSRRRQDGETRNDD